MRGNYKIVREALLQGRRTPHVGFKFSIPDDGLPYIIVVATGHYAARLITLIVENGMKYDVEHCPVCGNYTFKKIQNTWQCVKCGWFERDVNGVSESFNEAMRRFRTEAIRRSVDLSDLT